MRTILLAVLALPVVAAVAVLVAIARLARQLERDGVLTAPDDSEVVGMPTTWVWSALDDATIDAINAGLREASVGMTKPWRSPIDWDGILSGAVVPDHGRMT